MFDKFIRLSSQAIRSNENAARGGGYDDRPITPMKASFDQIARKFGTDEDDSRYDRSPVRESNERTLKNTRTMSASQRSTMNSMSRTIDARYAAKHEPTARPLTPAQTIGSLSRQKSSLNASIDDGKFKRKTLTLIFFFFVLSSYDIKR